MLQALSGASVMQALAFGLLPTLAKACWKGQRLPTHQVLLVL